MGHVCNPFNVPGMVLILIISGVELRSETVLDPDNYNYQLGTQGFGEMRSFTGKNVQVEQTDRMIEMGSNISKTGQLHDAASRSALKYVFTWLGGGYSPVWSLSGSDRQAIYNEAYAAAKRLLVEHNGSGKTFFLGNWEGDWMALGHYDAEQSITPLAAESFIAWAIERQKGIDAAKRDTPHENVEVFYYVEVNRVVDAMLHQKGRLINKVIPFIPGLDYLSYSAYDAQDLAQGQYNATLDYMVSQMKPKDGISARDRIFIGEFGVNAEAAGFNPLSHEERNRELFAKGLRYGVPFQLYWQMYDNEGKGFWLIDDKNKKWPLFYTLEGSYVNGRRFVEDFRGTQGRYPTRAEYGAWLLQWLEAIKSAAPPIAPTKATVTLNAGEESAQRMNATIAWIDQSGDEYGFRIERREGSGQFAEIVVAPANSVGFVDKSANLQQTRQYRIRAYNRAGMSGYSDAATSGTIPAVPAPRAPSGFAYRLMYGGNTEHVRSSGLPAAGPVSLSVYDARGRLLCAYENFPHDGSLSLDAFGPVAGFVEAASIGFRDVHRIQLAPSP